MDLFDDLAAAARPAVARKPWMESKRMELVTAETLPRVVDECIASGTYALDLETTGLDNRVYNGATNDKIVGICLSPDGNSGYYVPVMHRNHMHLCVPVSVVHREISRLVNSPAVAIFHNAKFDHEFLQFNDWGYGPLGEWDRPKAWEDTLILAYLRNTRERNKGLKHLSKVELDMEMIELNELFTEDELAEHGKDFSVLDPSWAPALWYACSDAICTYLLKGALYTAAIEPRDGMPTQRDLYEVEKLCVAATRWMERLRIPIDRERVAELIRLGQREWFPALREVYTEASKVLGRDISPGYFRLMDTDPTFRFDTEVITPGIMERVDAARVQADIRKMDSYDTNGKPKTLRKRVPGLGDKKKTSEEVDFPLFYDVLIPDQLGLLLRELGVDGLVATEKSGQIKTSKDELERVLESAGDDFEFIGKVKRFREVAKAIASNLMPIYEDSAPERSPDCRVRVNFEAFKTDTGRFSTPQPKEGRFTGTVRWNLQSIPAGYDPRRPECMTRLRECIRAPKGRMLYAIDYSGQELRVVTNLSGEPLWVTEFFRCSGCGHEFDRGATVPPPPEPPPPFCPTCGSDKIGDLHTLTALAVYGDGIKSDEKMFKQRRKEAKGVNFGLCYGGGGAAVQRATNCSKEEGWRIKRQFDKTYKALFAWWASQHTFARQSKHVLTAFRRRYPLPDIDSADDGFRAKAERNAVNGPVQGSGADIMKLAMGYIYVTCKKKGWMDRVRPIITIHDELVFEIDDDIAAEALPAIKEIMLKKVTARLSWRVPLTVDVEIGFDWTVPWNVTEIQYGKDDMPAELEHVLGGMMVKKAESTTEPEPEPTTEVEAAPTTQTVDEVPVNSPPKLDMPKLQKGDVYTHTIPTMGMTMRMAGRLARTIAECNGRGTNPLRVMDDRGNVLFDDPNVLVSPMEFTVLINRRGEA